MTDHNDSADQERELLNLHQARQIRRQAERMARLAKVFDSRLLSADEAERAFQEMSICLSVIEARLRNVRES